MSRITRDGFVNSGTSLDLKDLDADDRAALAKAGLDETALARIAGGDGVISGQSELRALFGLIDRLDHDGSYGSIATTTSKGGGGEVATASGQALEALNREIAEARWKHQSGGGERATRQTPAGLPVKSSVEGGRSDPGAKGARPNDPSWLKTAFGELGTREGAKNETNRRILEYFDRTYQKGQHSDDSGRANAWCGAFITFSLAENGIKAGKAVGAREFEKWGEPSEAFRGAIVVLQKGDQKHVAILAGVDKQGKNIYLGGNQGNAVGLSDLPGYEVVAVRKPPGYEIPADLKTLPTLHHQSRGTVSTR